jgi:hypothetical protein
MMTTTQTKIKTKTRHSTTTFSAMIDHYTSYSGYLSAKPWPASDRVYRSITKTSSWRILSLKSSAHTVVEELNTTTVLTDSSLSKKGNHRAGPSAQH